MPTTKDEKGRTGWAPAVPYIGELIVDAGDIPEAEVFEKTGAKVTVFRHERGWRIVGTRTKPIGHLGNQNLGEFTAEIAECGRCDPFDRSAPPRPHRPKLCTTVHRAEARMSDAHKRDYCHELGHPERITAFCNSVLRTY